MTSLQAHKYGSYLFSSLPLEQWRPAPDVFEICTKWLLDFPIESTESALARTILSRLNWNIDVNGEPFLPREIHVRTALLILETYSLQVPEVIGTYGVTESVRQAVKGQSARQQFVMWCWKMIFVLRLHYLDQSTETFRLAIANPGRILCLIPEIENLKYLQKEVKHNRPLGLSSRGLTSNGSKWD